MIKTVVCLISIAIANNDGSTPSLFDSSLPNLPSLYITESSTAETILHGVEIMHFRRIPIQISHEKSGLGSPVYTRIEVELLNSSYLPILLVEFSNNITRHGRNGYVDDTFRDFEFLRLVEQFFELYFGDIWAGLKLGQDFQSGESFGQNQLARPVGHDVHWFGD